MLGAPCMPHSGASAFPIPEFLVGSGISLWAVLAPLVACLPWSFPFTPHPSLELSFSFLLSSPSHYAESCPPLRFMLSPFHHLWDLASDSAPSSPKGPRPAWLQNSSQYLAWTESWHRAGCEVPQYWLVATWEPFKVGKAVWGMAAVST